jgi:hypothetical protein
MSFWQLICFIITSRINPKIRLMKLTVAVNVLMILLFYAILLLAYYNR